MCYLHPRTLPSSKNTETGHHADLLPAAFTHAQSLVPGVPRQFGRRDLAIWSGEDVCEPRPSGGRRPRVALDGEDDGEGRRIEGSRGRMLWGSGARSNRFRLASIRTMTPLGGKICNFVMCKLIGPDTSRGAKWRDCGMPDASFHALHSMCLEYSSKALRDSS